MTYTVADQKGRTPASGAHRIGAINRIPIPKLGVLGVLAFIAPLLRFVEIDIVGRLYLTDLVLATVLPFLLSKYGRRLSAPLPRMAIGLLVLWMVGQVATDLIRGSAFHDYARGWAMIGFTLINFCALYLLIKGRPERIVLFTAGVALGGLIDYFVAPSAYAITDPWKFGYGNSVGLLLALLAVGLARGRRFARLWPALILLVIAVLNIFMGFRSAGGIAFLASCYIAAQVLWRARSAPSRIKPRQFAILGATAAIAAWGVLQLYEYSVQSGWLGEQARQKYEAQAIGEYGLLLGGRSEILVSSRAVLDSPVLGHGSWAKNCHYASLYVELKRRAGYFPGEENEECLIPAHSHLMGAWVQAGVLGAVFWIWALSLPVRALARLYTVSARLAPLVALLAFLMIWDIFFSPFGGERRYLTAFYIVLMMTYLPGAHKKQKVRRARRVGVIEPGPA